MRNNLNKIMGIKSLTNWYSLGIILSSDGEGAKVVSFNGDIASKRSKWQLIKWDRDGAPYVTYNGIKHHLDEFMRVS